MAEQYVEAFHNLAKTNNTLILPSNVGDISSAVAHVSLLLKYLICTNMVNYRFIKVRYTRFYCVMRSFQFLFPPYPLLAYQISLIHLGNMSD